MKFELTIDTGKTVPPYQQVLEQLRSHILGGTFEAGEKLPSIRKMAAHLKLNPLTIAKAVNTIEQEGLIESRWGSGNFVLSMPGNKREKACHAALEKGALEYVKLIKQLNLTIEDGISALRTADSEIH